MTTNLALWTRPLVIFANPAALARLTPGQRRALAQAAATISPAASAALTTEDRDAAAQLCRAHFRLEAAPADGLRSIEQAVAPVYHTLSADPATRRAIAEIRALGPATPAAVPMCAEAQSAHGGKTAFDGVYRRSVTAEQLAREDHVAVEDATPENHGDFVLVIDGDRFAFTQRNAKACTWQYGRFAVAGDQMQWDFTDGGGLAPASSQNKPGEQFVLRPQLYRGSLTLEAITPPDVTTQVWHRRNETPSLSALDQRCHPPAAALTR